MIPKSQHLISSGGKRLRPMLTLAMAGLAGYSGDGHIKARRGGGFMHTATLLHDDVVDEGELRAASCRRGCLWATRRACWWATSCSARVPMWVDGRLAAAR